MNTKTHPAWQALFRQIDPEYVLGEVWMARRTSAFEVRHWDDRQAADDDLKTLSVEDLRELAQYTAEGAFRPLKTAPNLRRGWRCAARDEAALRRALDHLLPGVVADWHAARQPSPPVTHYREFTARQTGMYRNTAALPDPVVAQVARAVCAPQFCLRRRLWTAPGLAADEASDKSHIPCLEPCALLLEFARKSWRWHQADPVQASLSAPEWETVKAALNRLLHPEAQQESGREAEFNDLLNPRRVRFVLERLSSQQNPET